MQTTRTISTSVCVCDVGLIEAEKYSALPHPKAHARRLRRAICQLSRVKASRRARFFLQAYKLTRYKLFERKNIVPFIRESVHLSFRFRCQLRAVDLAGNLPSWLTQFYEDTFKAHSSIIAKKGGKRMEAKTRYLDITVEDMALLEYHHWAEDSERCR